MKQTGLLRPPHGVDGSPEQRGWVDAARGILDGAHGRGDRCDVDALGNLGADEAPGRVRRGERGVGHLGQEPHRLTQLGYRVVVPRQHQMLGNGEFGLALISEDKALGLGGVHG